MTDFTTVNIAGVPTVDVRVDLSNLHTTAIDVISRIRPDWREEDIKFTVVLRPTKAAFSGTRIRSESCPCPENVHDPLRHKRSGQAGFGVSTAFKASTFIWIFLKRAKMDTTRSFGNELFISSEEIKAVPNGGEPRPMWTSASRFTSNAKNGVG
jgi:hypothetical protein